MQLEIVNVEFNETVGSQQLSARERIGAFAELTKPRITTLIVLTAAAGFALGNPGPINYFRLLNTLIGIGLLSSGIACLNQLMERDLDRRMRRTAGRPLPTGRLSSAEALLFGSGLVVVSELFLAVVINPLTSALGIAVIVGYLFLYTPLKTRTSLSTVVGAFPGAMPPLLGWSAAANHLSAGAWVLFLILFLWQFPHFLAIAIMYREDYARAGIKMLPVVEPEGEMTARQIVLYAAALLPVSLLPTLLGIAGPVYFFAAMLLGILFLLYSMKAAVTRSRQGARNLLLASVVYLPLLFLAMVINCK